MTPHETSTHDSPDDDTPRGPEVPGEPGTPAPTGAHPLPSEEPLHGKVFRLARLLARHERRPGPAGGRGLHRGQGRVLALLELRQRMSQRELAFLLGVRPQSLGELLTKLERAGLVQRATDPSDRRTMTVELTPAGVEAAVEARTAHTRAESDPLEALTAQERAELARLLDLVIARIEEEDGHLSGPGHHPGHGPEHGGPFDDLGPFGPGGPRGGPRGPFGGRGRGRFGGPGREPEVDGGLGMGRAADRDPERGGAPWSDPATARSSDSPGGRPAWRRGRGRRGGWQPDWRDPRAAW